VGIMAIEFGKATRKSKFGKFKFGETKDSQTLQTISKTSPVWREDTISVSLLDVFISAFTAIGDPNIYFAKREPFNSDTISTGWIAG